MYAIIHIGAQGCNSAGESSMELLALLLIPTALFIVLFLTDGNVIIGIFGAIMSGYAAPVIWDSWGVVPSVYMACMCIGIIIKTIISAFDKRGMPL